ncbi:SDR family oxidoreductase [Sphingomonas populi]|uniref:SDR family oxidoreductase n=1 Tax=Sphingomonas populi TaxID=2484750 RepID=A0A4Q6XRR3_9SPHN|nr:SDR family oxidoreductase [Sphingomonas populi]RZF59197.1 SDR family oxidoreductase [Sphingomonas populi]
MGGVLEGAVALVTGASGGIGSATVTAMLEAGAEVIATDLRAPEIGTLTLAHDVTDEQDWQKIAATIQERWGRLDVLVNNAGVVKIATIEEHSLADWRRVMAVNADSMLLSHKAMLPLLKEAGKTREGGASIINISSTSGLVGNSFSAAYGASKGAVRLFSKCAAIEFAALRYNIRVNSVHPGGVKTNMSEHIFATFVKLGLAPDLETARAEADRLMAMGRTCDPKEIASGIVFLGSTGASFMTGSELVIDGGWTAS